MADNFAMQAMEGDHYLISGFAGCSDSLLAIANPFAGEEFDAVDLDALDAVGEFTNCINGLFASELSKEGVDIDMLPRNSMIIRLRFPVINFVYSRLQSDIM